MLILIDNTITDHVDMRPSDSENHQNVQTWIAEWESPLLSQISKRQEQYLLNFKITSQHSSKLKSWLMIWNACFGRKISNLQHSCPCVQKMPSEMNVALRCYERIELDGWDGYFWSLFGKDHFMVPKIAQLDCANWSNIWHICARILNFSLNTMSRIGMFLNLDAFSPNLPSPNMCQIIRYPFFL